MSRLEDLFAAKNNYTHSTGKKKCKNCLNCEHVKFDHIDKYLCKALKKIKGTLFNTNITMQVNPDCVCKCHE